MRKFTALAGILIAAAIAVPAVAQSGFVNNPPKMAVYTSSDGTGNANTWEAETGASGAGTLYFIPPPIAAYCSSDGTGNAGTWQPCTFTGGGGGAGVASINGITGAFTFSGSGVSCSATTCTFNGASTISSVSNSDGSLTISPTTGAVVASLNVAHANTWGGQQTFTLAPIFSSLTSAGSQCLEVNSSGQVIGTGSACGSGGGGTGLLANTSNAVTSSTGVTGAITTASSNGGVWRALNTSTTTGTGLSVVDTMGTAGQYDVAIARSDATNHQMPNLLLQNLSDNSGAGNVGSIDFLSTSGTASGYLLGGTGSAPSFFVSTNSSGGIGYLYFGGTAAGLTATAGDLYFNRNIGGKGAASTGNVHWGNTSNTDVMTLSNAGALAVTGSLSTPALTVSGITGSTQCLQVNTSGAVSGTGAACGSGGGGSTAMSALTAATANNTITNTANASQVWTGSFNSSATPSYLWSLGESAASTALIPTNYAVLNVFTASGSQTVPFMINQGEQTGSETTPAAQINCLWDTTGNVTGCLNINLSSAAAGSGSLAINTVNGANQIFSVDLNGNGNFAGTVTASQFTTSGTTSGSGSIALPFNSGNVAALPANSAGIAGPSATGGTSYLAFLPASAPTGTSVMTFAPATTIQGVNGTQAAFHALAGTGAGVTTGPIASTTNDCVSFADTAGTIKDSGSPCGSGGGSITGTDLYTVQLSGTGTAVTNSNFNSGQPYATVATTLSAACAAAATSCTITSATGWPASGIVAFVASSGSSNIEFAPFTLSGTTLTLTSRGYWGSTGTAWTSGADAWLVQDAKVTSATTIPATYFADGVTWIADSPNSNYQRNGQTAGAVIVSGGGASTGVTSQFITVGTPSAGIQLQDAFVNGVTGGLLQYATGNGRFVGYTGTYSLLTSATTIATTATFTDTGVGVNFNSGLANAVTAECTVSYSQAATLGTVTWGVKPESIGGTITAWNEDHPGTYVDPTLTNSGWVAGTVQAVSGADTIATTTPHLAKFTFYIPATGSAQQMEIYAETSTGSGTLTILPFASNCVVH